MVKGIYSIVKDGRWVNFGGKDLVKLLLFSILWDLFY